MTWINARYTFADAAARSQDVWELLVDNWGNTADPSADGTSESFPPYLGADRPSPGLPSCSALAIGPRSTVDRTLITWAMQKIVPNAQIWDYLRRLSVGAPLCFGQPGNGQPVGLEYTTPNEGAIGILPGVDAATGTGGLIDTVAFGGTFKALNGTEHDFGEGVAITRGAGGPIDALWVSPLLHLVFYLRSPQLAIPTKRFPFTFRESASCGVSGTEQLVAQIPIFGRKTVTVQMSPTQISNVRLSVLRNMSVVTPPQEQTVFSSAAVPINTMVTAALTDLYADYLLLWVNPTAVSDGRVITTVYATDD